MPVIIYSYPRWWKEGSGNICGLWQYSSEGDQAKDLFGIFLKSTKAGAQTSDLLDGQQVIITHAP